MKYVFLSPHLDDTTLSCGGWIFDLVQSGADVTVCCVMAGEPLSYPETPITQELHARWNVGESPVAVRRREEILANQRLGVDVKVDFWDIPDCIYRQGLYPDGEAIFGAVHPDDPAHNALDQYALPSHAKIIAPAGIGNHVDHQIVRDWARKHVPAERLIFYEDYPYAHQSDQILAIAERLNWTSQVKNITQPAFQAKYEAILCYASQISTFWRSDDELRARLHDYMERMAGDGTLAERYWHNQPNT